MHHRSSSMSRSMGLLRLKAILALTPFLVGGCVQAATIYSKDADDVLTLTAIEASKKLHPGSCVSSKLDIAKAEWAGEVEKDGWITSPNDKSMRYHPLEAPAITSLLKPLFQPSPRQRSVAIVIMPLFSRGLNLLKSEQRLKATSRHTWTSAIHAASVVLEPKAGSASRGRLENDIQGHRRHMDQLRRRASAHHVGTTTLSPEGVSGSARAGACLLRHATSKDPPAHFSSRSFKPLR
jgi:hypothetical protein